MTSLKEDSSLYEDSKAHAEFMAKEGELLLAPQLVTGTVSQVFDAWIDHVWVKPFIVVIPGMGRGQVGNLRNARGVIESIISVGLPDNADNKISSVCYKVHEFGPLPITDHLAFVSFEPDVSSMEENPVTMVSWNIKTIPASPRLQVLVPECLRDFAEYCKKVYAPISRV